MVPDFSIVNFRDENIKSWIDNAQKVQGFEGIYAVNNKLMTVVEYRIMV